MKPFNVRRWPGLNGEWVIFQRGALPRIVGPLKTQAEAIDYVYKNWPWYP